MQNLIRNEETQKLVRQFGENIRECYSIDPKQFNSYNIKRGLRNSDGTGVLAGVTGIGSVQGYMMLDGDPIPMPGRLYYRGMDVSEIIRGHVQSGVFGFEEVCYLLLLGKLPNASELAAFRSVLAEARHMPDGFNENVIFKSPNQSIMNKLATGVLSLYSYDDTPDDNSPENVLRQSIELIARLPIIVSNAYNVKRHYYNNESLYLHVPKDELSIAENLLRMIRNDKKYTPEEAHLLDLMLTLHAEHGGGNNSTFTCRVLSSTGTDTYGAICGAINALKGPLHGGANTKTMQMFRDIQKNVADPKNDVQLRDYLTLMLDKKAGDGSGKIYGLGHAVYTESDPRAVLLKQYAHDLAEKTGMKEDFDLMERIELIGLDLLTDKLKGHKMLCANVDMYSGLVYRMLGIPDEMFTPLFAIARVSGWCAHRLEEIISGGRLIRPGYKAVMPRNTAYVPIEERE